MAPGEASDAQAGAPRKAPNLVLRRIREQERHETREEFAEAMTRVARELGEDVFPDAKYIARLETGDIRYPRPVYRRIIAEVCGRPFNELGFDPPAILSLPTEKVSTDVRPSFDGSVVSAKISNAALRDAIMASNLEISQIARKVGVDPKSVQRWISRGVLPHPRHRWKASEILGRGESELWPQAISNGNGAGLSDVSDYGIMSPLINRRAWTRDELESLSRSFDAAMSHPETVDIEMLAHVWLSTDKPQLVDLRAGRRVNDSLISMVAQRVGQLRRMDDFVSGRVSYELVRAEIKATTHLLNEASLTENQIRRLLTATGELAQLAAWVAADAGFYRRAAKYAEGGVLAAHAADNLPLAANIISTLSYQLANTGNPREAAILARTAYAGARHSATATTKALLLERVAWADARSGDLNSCERALGQVEDNFSNADPSTDPDWVYWLSEEEINIMAGRCFTELKQPAKAESLLRGAISGYDSSHIRETSLYQSWLSEDYILLGEIDTASEIAAQVMELGRQANSARTDQRLRHLASMLKQYKDARSVADFLSQYEEYPHQ